MFIFKAGPRKVFRLKPVRCAKKVADRCYTGYVRRKRNSGEVCSRNYRNFYCQGRTSPGIIPVCSDYGQANEQSKERTTMDDAVC